VQTVRFMTRLQVVEGATMVSLNRFLCLVSLSVLTPTFAFAQNSPNASVVPSPGPTRGEPTAPPPRSGARRILDESLGGLLGSVVIGGLSGLSLGAVMCLTGCEDRFTSALVLPVIEFGGFVGQIFGVPYGVVVAGNRAGGHGRYGASLLGSLIANGIWIPVMGVLTNQTYGIRHDDPAALLFAASIMVSLTGSIVGYELSSGHPSTATPSTTTQRTTEAARATVRPIASVDQNGVQLGVVGMF
jgi:hypothetical protein